MKKKPTKPVEVPQKLPAIVSTVSEYARVTVTLNAKTGEMTVTSEMPKG